MDYKLTFEDGSEAYLTHYGVKGQKWGERNYQNPDGSLTPEGERRYRELNAKYGSQQNIQSINKGARSRKIVGGVVGGTAGLVGAAATAGLINNKRNASFARNVAADIKKNAPAYTGMIKRFTDEAKYHNKNAKIAGGVLAGVVGAAALGIGIHHIVSKKKAANKVLYNTKGATMSEIDEYMALKKGSAKTEKNQKKYQYK